MKCISILLAMLTLVLPQCVRGAETPQSLAGDAGALVAKGKWQSAIMEVKLRDGSVAEQKLVIEFNPSPRAGESGEPDAQAKLFTQSPTAGIKGVATANTELGDGNFRNVRLQETNGVRTMTITSAALEKDDPKRTQRQIERYQKLGGYWAITYPYELKDSRLTLKNFPTTNAVSWGVTEFTVPQSEITFGVVP